MIQESPAGPDYALSARRMLTANVMVPLLETTQTIPGINDVMAEPFDVQNHAGNMGAGVVIATVGTLAFAVKNSTGEQALTIPAESMGRFRRYGVVAVMAAAMLVNGVTETKWGVQHLPVAGWLRGDEPDAWDTAYSTATAGLFSLAFWKKTKQWR
jgi:hypothetical protein